MSIRTKMLDMALSEYGETDGDEYFLAVSDLNKYKGGHHNWCGAFMATMAQECGVEPPRQPETARRWLNFGHVTKTPAPGDICVLWRVSKSDWRGHVGMFIKQDNERVWLLGGNQSGKVCIKSYDRDRVLGYRRV